MINDGAHDENDGENRDPNVIGNSEDVAAAADKPDKKRKITRQQKRNNPFLGAMMLTNALDDTHIAEAAVDEENRMRLC